MTTVPGTTAGARYREPSAEVELRRQAEDEQAHQKERLSEDEVRYAACGVPKDLWPMLLLLSAKVAYKPRYEAVENEDGTRTQKRISDFEFALPTRNRTNWVYMAVPLGLKTDEDWRGILSQMADYGYAAGELAQKIVP